MSSEPRFHARLAPGVVDDPSQVVDLVIHAPARCDDVVIKVWELDVFRDPETGERRDEGTQDDLLAEFTGRIEPGDADRASAGWRRFVVASHRIVASDPDLARFRLRVCGGDVVYEVPIVSEAGEVEGRSYELGVSLEHGGQERHRTSVPCLFSPPRVHPVVTRRQVAGRLDDGAADPEWSSEGRLSLKHIAIGVAAGDPGPHGLGQRLHVLLRGFIDVHGQLVARKDDLAEGEEAQPLGLRGGRALHAYVYDDPDALPLGLSRIPIRACDPLDADGRVVREERALLDRGGVFSLGSALGSRDALTARAAGEVAGPLRGRTVLDSLAALLDGLKTSEEGA